MEWAEWNEKDALGKEDSNEEEEEVAVVKGKMVKRKKGKGVKINNTEALKGKYEDLRLDPEIGWIETLAVTSEAITHDGVDSAHDLNRELSFYGQAKEAVSIGLERLRAADVPIERPQDYFAEMVKSDSHMEFIRSKLAKQKERLERIETKKKDAELKKFGKGKQKLQKQEKLREKKEEIEKVRSWSRKRKTNNSDKELESLVSGEKKKKSKSELPESVREGSQKRGNKKKEHKLQKFAAGARKKGGWKKNDAESSRVDSFSVKRNKTPFQKVAGKKDAKKSKANRPGKNKRKEQVIKKNRK